MNVEELQDKLAELRVNIHNLYLEGKRLSREMDEEIAKLNQIHEEIEAAKNDGR